MVIRCSGTQPMAKVGGSTAPSADGFHGLAPCLRPQGWGRRTRWRQWVTGAAHALSLGAGALCLGPRPIAAQAAALPAVRNLGPIVAVARDSIRRNNGIRVLSGGRVMVNDVGSRRLLLLDSTLGGGVPILDTSTTAARTYPRSTPVLLPYSGDSTLILDATALAFLVLDPAGRVVRVMSLPRGQDLKLLLGRVRPAIDTRQRLIFPAVQASPFMPAPFGWLGTPPLPPGPDSAPLLRADLATHAIDTVAFLRVAKLFAPVVRVDSAGHSKATIVVNPLPVADDWTLMPDGTIAIIRAQDFHIDWVAPDGARTASAKLPHEWHRLSDSDKVAIVNAARQSDAAGNSPAMSAEFPDPQDLPDYQSPFSWAGTLADADGNVWIREPASPGAVDGPVYEIVNRKGTLFDRVRIPGGTVIVGFGPGLVYLSSRTGAGESLARARVR